MANTVYSKPTLWKQIVRGILDGAAAIMLVLAIVATLVSHVFFNSDIYKKIIFTPSFDESVKTNIYEALDSIYTIVEIPAEKIISYVGMDSMIVYEHEYTDQFIDSLTSGDPFEPKKFGDEKIRELVISEINSIENANVSEEDIENICECVSTKVNATLQFVPKLIVDRIGSASAYFSKIKTVGRAEIPLYMGFALFILANALFGGKEHRKDVFFGISAACWIAVCVIAIPLGMTYAYDFPAHLALETSTLKWLIVGLADVIFKVPSIVFNILFIILTVVLGFACYVKCAFVKKSERKHFYRAHFDD